jgi:hypothetical protein
MVVGEDVRKWFSKINDMSIKFVSSSFGIHASGTNRQSAVRTTRIATRWSLEEISPLRSHGARGVTLNISDEKERLSLSSWAQMGRVAVILRRDGI